MKNLLLLAALAALSTVSACKKADAPAQTNAPAPAAQATADNLPTATIDEVDTGIAKGDIQPVDANGTPTRQKMGVIPGAVLLTDSDSFALTELPADKSKSLVFYCGNTACMASHHAAAKAVAAGYQHVRVMPDGIAGWVKAGKKVQTI